MAAPLERKERSGWRCGTWSWEARIRRERGRGGRRSGGRGVEQERRKGERATGGTPSRIRFRVPVALMTAIHPSRRPRSPAFPSIAPLPSPSLSLLLSVSLPAGRTRAPPLDDAPSPLDTPPHKATHIQDDSNYVTTSRACDLLPPPAATHFLLPTPASSALRPGEVPIALYLRGPNSPASNPPVTPPSRGGHPRAGPYTHDMWCAIYLFRYSGQHSTRLRGSRQSPLVHRAACYSSSFTTFALSLQAGREIEIEIKGSNKSR